jgi:pimeloyl-ACP methyl ester carboxylesterase
MTATTRQAPPAVVTASPREQSRARYPDETGFVERDGVRVFWERYGSGLRTILLMPTYSILHSRRWKAQIPFLARHWQVVTFDGRGNGRSDRPADVAAYADTEFVADAVAVMDATAVARAVVVGLSMGGGWALRLAAEHPDRVEAAVFEGASVPIADPLAHPPPRPAVDKYDYDYRRANHRDFAEFFFDERIPEPHSTKQIEDGIGWALETDAESLIRASSAPYLDSVDGDPTISAKHLVARALAARVRCPSIVIHGGDDHVVAIRHAEYLARSLGAPFVRLEGAGHLPANRDPVRFNLLLRDFIRSLPAADR